MRIRNTDLNIPASTFKKRSGAGSGKKSFGSATLLLSVCYALPSMNKNDPDPTRTETFTNYNFVKTLKNPNTI